jgi:DnaK suppressor protein
MPAKKRSAKKAVKKTVKKATKAKKRPAAKKAKKGGKKKKAKAKAKKPAKAKKATKGKAKAKKAKGKVKTAKAAKPSTSKQLKKKGSAALTVNKTSLVNTLVAKQGGATKSLLAGAKVVSVVGRQLGPIGIVGSKAKKVERSMPVMQRSVAKGKAALKEGVGSRGFAENSMSDIHPYQVQDGEEYMNEKQRTHFRKLLHHWKRELMEEVDRTVHHMQDEAANFPDPNDRATQEEEFSLELRTRDRERKLIKKIEEALEKLDRNEYGYCDACGIEIGIRRLEARPTATLCIDCKTLDEIKEKQMAG